MAEPLVPEPAQLEERDAATIGVVEAVSPRLIDIAVLTEAPHGTGLREGTFHRFPRINSYVVLPSERGSILAMVVWLGIEDEHGLRSTEPDRIGLPLPRRKLRALPLGVLRRAASVLEGDDTRLVLDRGVLLFPTVGDPVRLPTRAEAAAAVPTHAPDALTLLLGRAPLAGDVEVQVDPNRLFGRHLAVLGNTGSGKSCTVAQLIRSSAQAAGAEAKAFRAIVLDMNGEYQTAFDDLGDHIKIRRFSASPADDDTEQLRVPAWLWNYREWLSFSDASAKSQAPVLRRSLQILRTTQLGEVPGSVVGLIAGRRVLRHYAAGSIEGTANAGNLSVLDNSIAACQVLEHAVPTAAAALQSLRTALTPILDKRRGDPWKFGAAPLNMVECGQLAPLFQAAVDAVGIPDFLGDGTTVDSPVAFNPADLIELVPLVALDSGSDASGWVAPMLERLRISLADERLQSISGWRAEETLGNWITALLSTGDSNQISVIDLSLVPTHVLHTVVASFSRLILEALERHRRLHPDVLIPTILVVEEAHTLIPRRTQMRGDDETVAPGRLCRDAFERIAREGRKFGLSLVVSSQRPSELSETVLSQCNTFLIHRIVNDHDQDLIRRLVPDALGGLTEELPALPSQTGLLVGWAIEVPTLVRIADLAVAYQPRSADPDFGGAWRGADPGHANWTAVAVDWAPGTGIPEDAPEHPDLGQH